MNKRNFKGWLYLLPAMLFLGTGLLPRQQLIA